LRWKKVNTVALTLSIRFGGAEKQMCNLVKRGLLLEQGDQSAGIKNVVMRNLGNPKFSEKAIDKSLKKPENSRRAAFLGGARRRCNVQIIGSFYDIFRFFVM
jgi:hypothetical protein